MKILYIRDINLQNPRIWVGKWHNNFLCWFSQYGTAVLNHDIFLNFYIILNGIFSQKHAFIRFASKSQYSNWTGSKEFSTQWANCAFYRNSLTCMSVNVCFLCWKDILETWTLQYKFLILCFIHNSNLGLYVQF